MEPKLSPTPANPVSKMSPVSPLNAMSRPVSPTSPIRRVRQNAELQELLAMPARLVSGLPVPVCLRLHVPGAPVPVVLWSGVAELRDVTPVLADTIVFDGGELEAMLPACEADRLWHPDFLGLCFEKWRRPEVPVRSAELLGGANAEPDAGWTLGRLFTRLGIELEAIELEVEPIARPLHAAA